MPRRFLPFIVLATLSISASSAHAQTIWYVNDDAAGANDGTSWNDAFVELQSALTVAQAGDQIWVSEGLYLPDYDPVLDQHTGDRSATFQMLSGVAVYGGFDGAEAVLEDRTGLFRETILSGDLLQDDGIGGNCCIPHDEPGCSDAGCEAAVCEANSDCCAGPWSDLCSLFATNLCDGCGAPVENSYHVVSANDTNATAVLNGFEITSGNANDDTNAPHVNGAGMLVTSGSPTITNCSFSGNTASGWGGALLIEFDSSPIITDCIFAKNYAGAGGAIFVFPGSSATLINCRFTQNTAVSSGGAIYITSGDATLRNCLFADNMCDENGGAIASDNGNAQLANCRFTGNMARDGGAISLFVEHVSLTNCLLSGNQATSTGGALWIGNQAPALVNCTFVHNYAPDGGGIFSSSAQPTLTNVILWGNIDAGGMDEAAQITLEDGSVPSINYTTIQGLTGGLGGIGNNGEDAVFMGGPNGTWTAHAEYDESTFQTTFFDDSASWTDNQFAAHFVNPDTSHNLQSTIASNSTTTLTVWGDYADLGVMGVTYQINDYRLRPGSPCIDAADNSAVPADDFDLDGDGDTTEPIPQDLDSNPRFVDDINTPDTGNGAAPIVDMGAYEGADCNGNGVLDQQDIADLTSNDCNSNNIPDECDLDTDGDGLINACEDDDDNDGVEDDLDSDPLDPFVCEDLDGDTCNDCSVGQDGFGSLPDNDPLNDGPDGDGDGICDLSDPCPLDDPDDVDGDGVCDSSDVCPGFDDTLDGDMDGTPDDCDPCPSDNPDDSDNDGVCESLDACPGFDDALDFDGDTVPNGCDNCPVHPNEDQGDCDEDAIGDVCAIELGVSEDCNFNVIPDECDIADGTSVDANDNSVPDECEICSSSADCADSDGDKVRDDNCLWWVCSGSTCLSTDIPFADMGGQFGQCQPDLAADGNDRFHALNCFANTDSDGSIPYPCEAAAPAAYNVDAGGPFGSCISDGVCDGNDAFHALNAFEGSTTCSCPLDGTPAPVTPIEKQRIQSASLRLAASSRTVRPGGIVEVDVYLDTPLDDLRGYQLHLGVAGDRTGDVELVDISVENRKDHVFRRLPYWTAFNVETGQMLVGMDQPGVPVKPGYLATFTYRLIHHDDVLTAVSLFADHSDNHHRTFLFTTENRYIVVRNDSKHATRSRIRTAP